MKNKILLQLIYIENETSVEHAQECWKKIQNAIEKCKNHIYQLHYKRNVLAKSLKVFHGTPVLRGTQCEYQWYRTNSSRSCCHKTYKKGFIQENITAGHKFSVPENLKFGSPTVINWQRN
jgi:hypothetical protein